MNLTWYHRAFLTHLIGCRAPFLIVGGQARIYYQGGTSSDLDLWMPPDNCRGSGVQTAIVGWATRYPNHRLPPIREPLPLNHNTQIQFPNGNVWVLTDEDEIIAITNDTRIDILFGIEGLDFARSLQCATEVDFAFGQVKLLCRQDLEFTSVSKVGC